MVNVILVLLRALDVHLARIPIALLRYALRRPMRPDTKLGVAKPVWRLELFQRVPGWLKDSGGNIALPGMRCPGQSCATRGARQCLD